LIKEQTYDNKIIAFTIMSNSPDVKPKFNIKSQKVLRLHTI